MKRDDHWRRNLAIFLLLLSGIFYLLHYLVFHDRHYLLYYPMLDIAFLPIQVLLVTIGVDRILGDREKKSMLQKMNMVIGAFFSEAGNTLARSILTFDADSGRTSSLLRVDNQWSAKQFLQTVESVKALELRVDSHYGDLPALKAFLVKKREFLLTLLENPNLLEHERFTELLWAVFHLTEELANREELTILPESDFNHLSGDIRRVYGLLLVEWLVYMRHLKSDYPYLFSLAVRTNPFDPAASAVVRSTT